MHFRCCYISSIVLVFCLALLPAREVQAQFLTSYQPTKTEDPTAGAPVEQRQRADDQVHNGQDMSAVVPEPRTETKARTTVASPHREAYLTRRKEATSSRFKRYDRHKKNAPVPEQKIRTPSKTRRALDENDSRTVSNATSAVFAPDLEEAPMVAGNKAVAEKTSKNIAGDPENTPPVDFAADNLVNDDNTQIITASGNVVLTQDGRTVKADQVRYYKNEDRVVAKGNVILLDQNGDTHMAQEAALDNAMKEGFVIGVKSYLAEGGKFTAKKAERRDEKILMTDASYTPCDCETDEDGNPTWQISADELVYDEAENRVSYKNAKFEIFGVPVLWTPFLSHPDGQIKQKSGFLAPGVGYDSELGFNVLQSYYWAIAPHKDATFGVMLTSQKLPVALGQYRQRFENASLVVDGSATYSGRTDSVNGLDVVKDEETRGHLFAQARWDINDKWRAGSDLQLTTDDQYLRQYDLSTEDVLENEIYAERFSGRNYAVGRVLAFQDVRIREERTDQPNVLPEVLASFVGEPNQTLGGRWQVDLSGLALQRDGNGQDMSRLVAEASWQRRYESEYGLLTTADLKLRGDAYHTRDRNAQTPPSARNDHGSDTRAFAQAHLVSSYPLVRNFDKTQVTIEPLAALTLAPNIDVESGYIPNEDSNDVQIDASNLFNADRFPGKDRIEDDSRVTYGMKTGVYGYGGSFLNAFIGQSYRFDEKGNPFPEGSGLARQESDIVGQLAGMYDEDYGFNYRFQIGSDKLDSQRHEFEGYANWGRFSMNTRYLYAKPLEGTDIEEDREQIDALAGYYLTPEWRLSTRGVYDLGAGPGLRKAGLGLDYYGCCMSFSLNADRTLTADASGDSGTNVTLRLGLKNLGEFQTSNAKGFGANN